jgi:hypothetical protein
LEGDYGLVVEMIVSTAQPYFCPYPGYFARAMASDVFVVLDTVQFPRGTTWITRNRFKNDQGTLWLNVPVWKKGLGLQKISEVKICREGRWQRKHIESVIQAYHHAPYFREHIDFIESLFLSDHVTIAEMNMAVIVYVMKFLQAGARVALLSELGIEQRGSMLLVEICRVLGAEHYLAAASARAFLDEGLFQDAGIESIFFKPPTLIYPQLWGPFIPNLSIFDLIFNCGPKARELVLGGKEGTRQPVHLTALHGIGKNKTPF